jgi:cobalt-zinc-cadmium efflux system protein
MHHGHECAHPPPAAAAGCHGCAPDAPAARHEHEGDRRRLLWTIGLTGVIFAAEVVGGLVSGSLALLSDAGHMLTDVSAQVISLFALIIAARPADDRRTYGYRRLEILAALANGVLLAGLAAVTLVSALRRFGDPPAVHTGVMIGVAAVGLVANALAAFLLSHSHSLNVRGAYLHILSDLLSSVAVVVGGVVMAVRPGTWLLDPVLGLAAGPRRHRRAARDRAEGHRHRRGAPGSAQRARRGRRARPARVERGHELRGPVGARGHRAGAGQPGRAPA